MVNAEQKLFNVSLKHDYDYYNMIFVHPPVSFPDGPDSLFVLIAAHRILSANVVSNFTGCIFTGVSVRRTLSYAGLPFGSFCFNKSKVYLLI